MGLENKDIYKIVVCFKITDDFDELGSSDWGQTDDNGYPITDFVRRLPGCFDEAALENGLLLKEELKRQNLNCRLWAVTVNPGYSEHILNRLAAVGYDEIVCIHTKGNLDFSPRETARLLGDFIKKEGMPDLVLAGLQSAPGNTGLVPFYLSRQLLVPVRQGVKSIDIKAGKFLPICEYREAYIQYTLEAPAVCILGNADKSFLRIPSLKEKIKAKDFKYRHISCESRPGRPPKLSYAVKERQCRFLECKDRDGMKEVLSCIWKNKDL